MNLKLLSLIVTFFSLCLASAQVIYDENFDNLTVGNVGNDLTGAIPGQGSWYTLVGDGSPPPLPDASHFQIQNETGKGKVLSLKGVPMYGIGFVGLEKRELGTLWDTRTSGSNVLKFKCDFFTGNAPLTSFGSIIGLYGKKDKLLAGYALWHNGPELWIGVNTGENVESIPLNNNGKNITLSKDKWYQLVMYIDYNNAQIHYEIPVLGITKSYVVFDLLTSPDSMKNYPPDFISFHTKNGPLPDQFAPPTVKLDNVKITAIWQAPVSTADFLASKLVLYPNPVNEILSITTKENIKIEDITIYNANGKVIKPHQIYDIENGIQLNLQDLSAGIYLLHIKTNEGETVKKIIKK
ncbi:MAG TPA: T9SS type A sorting domain-containing protein [Flavobacterium sp.]|nr:T9SS type A sorting domain-containing protein [Flavobacterium sp.]